MQHKTHVYRSITCMLDSLDRTLAFASLGSVPGCVSVAGLIFAGVLKGSCSAMTLHTVLCPITGD